MVGEVAERLKAPVLKIGRGNTLAGSNPALSVDDNQCFGGARSRQPTGVNTAPREDFVPRNILAAAVQ